MYINALKIYKRYHSFQRHLKYGCNNKAPQFKCKFCDKLFKRPDTLKNHKALIHQDF